MRLTGILSVFVVLLSILDVRAADDRAVFFESKVRPILAARCHGCHGAKKQESSLRLDTKQGFLKGGDNGRGRRCEATGPKRTGPGNPP